jgi:hypothetical protein
MYKGAWITANGDAVGGPDLVCWNCAAIESKGAVQEVWVWEMKSWNSKPSEALDSLNNGIRDASNDIMRGKQNGIPIPVRPGRRFPNPSAGVNPMKPNQIVTVFSDPRSAVDTGIEYYRKDDFEKKVPATHKMNQPPTR